MTLFGIGPFELLLILIIALIVLGPNDMVKAGRSLGKFIRKFLSSPEWRSFQQATREIRHLPENLMREAGMENPKEFVDELSKEAGFDQIGKDLNQNIDAMQKEIASQANLPPATPSPTTLPPSIPEKPTHPPTKVKS
jgi:Sec-independent protein translocase protein TatA